MSITKRESRTTSDHAGPCTGVWLVRESQGREGKPREASGLEVASVVATKAIHWVKGKLNFGQRERNKAE